MYGYIKKGEKQADQQFKKTKTNKMTKSLFKNTLKSIHF